MSALVFFFSFFFFTEHTSVFFPPLIGLWRLSRSYTCCKHPITAAGAKKARASWASCLQVCVCACAYECVLSVCVCVLLGATPSAWDWWRPTSGQRSLQMQQRLWAGELHWTRSVWKPAWITWTRWVSLHLHIYMYMYSIYLYYYILYILYYYCY